MAGKKSVSLLEVAGQDRPAAPAASSAAPAEGEAARPERSRKESVDVARASLVGVSLYVHEDTLQRARAAYLRDYALRGPDAPRTLNAWVAEAVRQLAALTPQQRKKRLDALPPEPERVPVTPQEYDKADEATRVTYTQVLDEATGRKAWQRPAAKQQARMRFPEDTVARLDEATDADMAAMVTMGGRSPFVCAAMRYGTERARRLHEERTGEPQLPALPEGDLPRRGRPRR